MYHGPKGSRIYSWLLKKKSSHRYIGSFLIIVSILVIWYFFLCQPLNSLIDLAEHNIISAQTRLAHGERATKKCQELEQKIKEYSNLIANASFGYGSDCCIAYLVDQVNKSALTFDSCSRIHEMQNNNQFDYCALDCKLHGTSQQILTFFDNIIQDAKFIGCSHISLMTLSTDTFDLSCQIEFALK